MKKSELCRWLLVAAPLLGLALLIIFFKYSVSTYVRCEYPRIKCDAITTRLDQILGTFNAEINKPLESDSIEIKEKKEIRAREHVALKSNGRISFIFLAMVYFLVCCIAFGVGLFVLSRSLMTTTKHPIHWVLGASAVSLVFGIILFFNPDAYMSVFMSLFENRVKSDVTGIDVLLKVINSFGFGVCLLLTLSVCATLSPRNVGTSPEGLKQLSLRMKYLRTVLYVGTLMLIVGVMLIRTIYQWSLAFMVRDAAALKIAESFFANLLATEGGFFTLVLAVVYLPAAFILRRRADALTGLPEMEAEKETVLQNYNLAFSFSKSLPRVAAILGPVLVGPIGELVGRLA